MRRPLSARLSSNFLRDLSRVLRDPRGRKKSVTLNSLAIVTERVNEIELPQAKHTSMLQCQKCLQACMSEITLESRSFVSFCDSCDVQDIKENLQFAGIRNSRLDHFL